MGGGLRSGLKAALLLKDKETFSLQCPRCSLQARSAASLTLLLHFLLILSHSQFFSHSLSLFPSHYFSLCHTTHSLSLSHSHSSLHHLSLHYPRSLLYLFFISHLPPKLCTHTHTLTHTSFVPFHLMVSNTFQKHFISYSLPKL